MFTCWIYAVMTSFNCALFLLVGDDRNGGYRYKENSRKKMIVERKTTTKWQQSEE